MVVADDPSPPIPDAMDPSVWLPGGIGTLPVKGATSIADSGSLEASALPEETIH